MALKALRDRLDRLANPMLVKEMYQSIHNRKFLAGLWLLLFGALLTYIFMYAGGVNEAYGDGRGCGREMFGLFAIFSFVMGSAILPYLTFENLNEEIKGRTIELIHITTLDARRQIRGRMMAAMVKIALLFAVIGPFAVASFLFKGIGVETILIILFLILLCSLLGCATALVFAALTSIHDLRTVAKIGFFLTLFWVIPALVYAADEGILREFSFVSPKDISTFAALLVALTIVACVVISFLCAAAANTLTFEADKNSGRTRFFLLLLIVTLCGLFAAPFFARGEAIDEEVTQKFVQFGSVLLGLCSCFWLTGPRRIAQRVRRKLESRGPLYRMLWFPFTDGPGPAAVHLFAGAALIWALASGMSLWGHLTFMGAGHGKRDYWPLFFWTVYALYLAALARGAVRLLPERFHTPRATRGMLLALLGLNILVAVAWVPHIRYDNEPSVLGGLFPIVCAASHHSGLVVLILPLLIGLAYHVVAIMRSYRRYSNGEYG